LAGGARHDVRLSLGGLLIQGAGNILACTDCHPPGWIAQGNAGGNAAVRMSMGKIPRRRPRMSVTFFGAILRFATIAALAALLPSGGLQAQKRGGSITVGL